MSSKPVQVAHSLRFGDDFELDLRAYELRRDGISLKLKPKAMELLLLLIEHKGELVTRKQIVERIWGKEVFVDTDNSINAAINRIRQVLRDDPAQPCFVQTVTGKGYRFIAPIVEDRPRSVNPTVVGTRVAVPARLSDIRLYGSRLAGSAPDSGAYYRVDGRIDPSLIELPSKAVVLLGVVAVMLVATAWGIWHPLWPRPEAVTASQALTHAGRVMFPDRYLMQFPALATDGTRVYFSRGGADPSWGEKLSQASLAGGPTADIGTPFRRQVLHGISADKSKLLVQENRTSFGLDAQEGSLWALPLAGQTPFRLGDILAHAAAWSPDGKQLVFANGQDLFVAGWDGSNPRKLTSTSGRVYWIRWAPDGAALRFTLADHNFRTSLWEVRTDGSGLRRLFYGWRSDAHPCCGEWSPDGRHFVFLAYENGRSDIWMRRESKGFLTSESDPVRLTSGPLNFASVIFSADGKKLIAVSPQGRETVVKFHLGSRQIEPYTSEAVSPAFSRDRQWMAYTEGSSGTLWRSRPDGSEALQLTTPPLQAGWASWSPDGKQVAFIGHTAGGPYKLYVVASSGGAVRQLIPGDRQEIDPNWSPDGGSIMFGRPPDVLAEQGMPKAIYLLDLKSGKTTTLPGSDGMFAPRWTPDGRFVVTMPHKNWDRLIRFDFASRKWSELVPYDAAQLALSPDGEWVYFESEHNGHNVSRARLRDGRIERLLDFAVITRGTLMTCGFEGVELDGSPLLLCNVNASELYSLDLDLP